MSLTNVLVILSLAAPCVADDGVTSFYRGGAMIVLSASCCSPSRHAYPFASETPLPSRLREAASAGVRDKAAKAAFLKEAFGLSLDPNALSRGKRFPTGRNQAFPRSERKFL